MIVYDYFVIKIVHDSTNIRLIRETKKNPKMFAEVDVFISNYTLVDPDIYQLWTEGYSCKCNNISFTSGGVVCSIIIVCAYRMHMCSMHMFIHSG